MQLGHCACVWVAVQAHMLAAYKSPKKLTTPQSASVQKLRLRGLRRSIIEPASRQRERARGRLGVSDRTIEQSGCGLSLELRGRGLVA
jgi:hypothetical protein